jgi:hypothetical protein
MMIWSGVCSDHEMLRDLRDSDIVPQWDYSIPMDAARILDFMFLRIHGNFLSPATLGSRTVQYWN